MTNPPNAITSPSFSPQQVTEAIRAGLSRHEDVVVEARQAADLTNTYLGNLDHCRQHVQQSLADGDYRQAAEKSWGAYSQAIKIIGAVHGLHITSHRSILQVSGQLTALVNPHDAATAAALTYGLVAARAMHIHFYENDLPAPAVAASAGTVAAAIDLLHELFPANRPDPAA